MGDDVGLGLLSTILGGLLRGAQVAKPVIQQGITKGIRFADPRRLAPLIQQVQKGPLFRPIPLVEKAIQKTPIIKDLPEWARGLVGINTSPAGIGGAIAASVLLDKFLNQFEAAPTTAAPHGTTLQGEGKTPEPAAGPRVDASTTQLLDIGAPAPQQARRLVPVTPTAPPAPAISQAAYDAAQAGFGAPTSTPLAEFYGAQEAIGRYAEQGGELQRRLKEAGGAAGMSDTALMEWVKANPALAYRELVRREKRPVPNVD